MESIPAASTRPMSSFSSVEIVARPGPLRSLTFTSAIDGLRGVPAISTRPIRNARCTKDGAAREARPILIPDGIVRVAISFSDSRSAALLRLRVKGAALTL